MIKKEVSQLIIFKKLRPAGERKTCQAFSFKKTNLFKMHQTNGRLIDRENYIVIDCLIA